MQGAGPMNLTQTSPRFKSWLCQMAKTDDFFVREDGARWNEKELLDRHLPYWL